MDNRVKFKFNAINDLNKNINNLLITEANKFKTLPKELPQSNFADHKAEKQKFEDDVRRNILYNFKVAYPHDNGYLKFSNTVAEIKKQAADKLQQKTNLILL